MANISNSLKTSAFEQNPSNPGAVIGDSTALPGYNTYRSGNATVTDVESANSKSKAAQEAEKKWITETVGANDNDSRKSNRIKLVSTKVSTGDGSNTGFDSVQFYLSPEISENKQVIYAEIGELRQAASILIYIGSPSRKWSVNAKFLSRTPKEADMTWKSIQLLKSWTDPDSNYKYGIDASGTPHVLKLYGYGRTWQGIPVVLTQLTVEYPVDVDYVQTDYGTNVPIIQNVTFSLTEARTPNELNDFDLEKFKLGILPEW